MVNCQCLTVTFYIRNQHKIAQREEGNLSRNNGYNGQAWLNCPFWTRGYTCSCTRKLLTLTICSISLSDVGISSDNLTKNIFAIMWKLWLVISVFSLLSLLSLLSLSRSLALTVSHSLTLNPPFSLLLFKIVFKHRFICSLDLVHTFYGHII